MQVDGVECMFRLVVRFMGLCCDLNNVCWKCVVWSVVVGVYYSLRPLGVMYDVYACVETSLCMFWGVLEAVDTREPSFCPSAETQVRPPKWLSAAEPPCGGSFGCRSLPPKLKFRLCLGGSAAESAAEPAWLSAAEGLSAAEPAAESALFSHFLHVFMWCFQDVLGGFWGVF